MWPRFWFCVGLVKGPLEIMGANYGDYDTVHGWSIVPKASHCLAQQTPTDCPFFLPFGLFSYHWEYFQIINMTIIRLFWLQKEHGVNWTCVPMGKGHPEEPSGLYRKAAQHFEVLGTSRRKRGLELELAKKTYCWPQLQFILLYNFVSAAEQYGGVEALGHYCERRRWQKGCESCHHVWDRG